MIETLIQLIPSLGLPTICVISCGLFINNMWNKEQIQHEKREKELMNQMDKFSNTLDKFNTTLTKIDTRLEIVENRIK